MHRRGRLSMRSRLNALDADAITVRLGEPPNQQEIPVNESIISPRSAFAEQALTKLRADGTTDLVVDIPNADPKVFRQYMAYLKSNITPLYGHDLQDQFVQSAKLYALAATLADVGAKNVVLGEMLHLARKGVMAAGVGRFLKAVDIIYKGTPEHNLGKRLMLDLFADFGSESWLKPEWEAPDGFLRELATQLLRRRPLPVGYNVFTCDDSEYQED
ncbi:hypothetical protein BDV95DRAFT_670126 [Massariosphaeria phaeospora]|uniref:BTB domain-containing protein n=1 Tax=Massariosphaeria phaeospora TaxID=100035 RepID=A0A7C8I2K5_9PLEO|nr:hypothetical protein BDV95DRAFT_670126 [Massariosphaeria phaeospora]